MKKKSGFTDKKWIQSRAFYAVAASLLLLIFGVGAAIYNVAKIRTPIYNSRESTVFTVPDVTSPTGEQANAAKTDVADERDETTESSTANDLNRPFTGYYLLPLNSEIIKDYSDGEIVLSETMGDWRTHDGIDISGKQGENVIAVQDGRVISVNEDPLWGCTVRIKHGNGLTAEYRGVKSSLHKDDKVNQGEVIGTLDTIPIESKQPPHVHLETYVDDKLVSPVKALNLLSSTTTQAADEE